MVLAAMSWRTHLAVPATAYSVMTSPTHTFMVIVFAPSGTRTGCIVQSV